MTSTAAAAAYDFGELPLRFECSDLAWLSMLERRYGRFRSSDSSTGAFRIRFENEGPPPGDLVSPLAARPESIVIAPGPRGFRATTATSACDVDLVAGEALVRAPSAMYPLDNLLVQLLPLLRANDVLFHGAALALDGRGLITTGPSGAGKSTLARLAGEDALCDEVAAARTGGGGTRVVSLPFWVARPGTAPLDAILLLAHAEDHALRRVGAGEAMRRLSRLVLWPAAFPAAMERVLALLASLLESVPVYELAFAPRRDAVTFLRKELP